MSPNVLQKLKVLSSSEVTPVAQEIEAVQRLAASTSAHAKKLPDPTAPFVSGEPTSGSGCKLRPATLDTAPGRGPVLGWSWLETGVLVFAPTALYQVKSVLAILVAREDLNCS